MRWILLFCILGLALSSYAVYVEHMAAKDESFKALCDMTETISCSKVFSSDFGKILSYWGIVNKGSVLDQPNAVFGMIFYLLVFIVSEILKKSKTSAKILLLVACSGVALSAYLAYVLVFHLQDFCLVCTGSYICNAGIFISAVVRYRNAHALKATDKVE
jgi:vitamin-K-epoxide reductase (warfarin-sensitive)